MSILITLIILAGGFAILLIDEAWRRDLHLPAEVVRRQRNERYVLGFIIVVAAIVAGLLLGDPSA